MAAEEATRGASVAPVGGNAKQGAPRHPPLPYRHTLAMVLIVAACGAVATLISLSSPLTGFETAQGNFRGNVMMQVFQTVPALRKYYTMEEASFNVGPGLYFSKDHWEVPLVAVAVYAAMVYFGPKYMASNPPLDLRVLLALWNWLLAVFSFLGALRTVTHLGVMLVTQPFRDTICVSPEMEWGVGATGLWVQLFIFSKIPELLDTAFIVLRKKPLIFLHWYHHITVLLYCWHSYATECGAGLYFVAMNYVVHAFMYAYYSMAALGVVPRWFPTILITLAQIAQMFAGMFICISSWYYTLYSHDCHNDITNLILGGAMYLSYLYLFVDFAIGRYLRKGKKAKAE